MPWIQANKAIDMRDPRVTAVDPVNRWVYEVTAEWLDDPKRAGYGAKPIAEPEPVKKPKTKKTDVQGSDDDSNEGAS